MIKYKGYIGKVTYDSTLKIFHGDVIGLQHVITFEGKNPEELERSFKDAIEDYLEMCKDENIKPERTFTGKFIVRIPVDLHKRLAQEAMMQKKSLNAYLIETLSKLHKTKIR